MARGWRTVPFLATSTASGLCRVDWLTGRFLNDRVPFVAIEAIRGEVEQGAVESEENGRGLDKYKNIDQLAGAESE